MDITKEDLCGDVDEVEVKECFVALKKLQISNPLKNEVTTPKRSERQKIKPKKFGDYINTSPTKRKKQYESSSEDEIVENELENALKKSSGKFLINF